MSAQIRGGDSGKSRGTTPNEHSAEATAFAITPPTGMIPPSPAPFAPSGLIGDGFDVRKIFGGGDEVIRERTGKQLTVVIINELLEYARPQSLHDRSKHLT